MSSCGLGITPQMARLWRNVLGLMGTLALLAPSDAAESPAQAWANSRITSCGYDVDLTGLEAPYRAFESHGGMYVCPFLAGQARTTRAYAQKRAPIACATSDIAPLPATAARPLSVHQFGNEMRSCLAIMAGMPTRKPSGPVYVLTAPALSSDEPLSLFEALAVATRTGLPISDGHVEGDDQVQHACLQLLPGAAETPLAYLRAVGARLPNGVTETRMDAPNCDKVPGLRARHAPDLPEPFTVRLRQAGTGAAAVGPAVRTQLVSLGVDVPDPVDGFHSLEPGDKRLVVVRDLRPGSAGFEVRQLTPDLCAAVYRVMIGADAFLTPSDDEAPTIVARGESSGPPPRYATERIEWVGSARELCAALAPAYKRAKQRLDALQLHRSR